MRRTQTKIKVNTPALLEAIRRRRQKMLDEHNTALTSYDEHQAAYQSKVIQALEKACVRAKSGKWPERSYNNRLWIELGVEEPDEPTLDLSTIDRLIQTLEMTSDESISIGADDAAEYLG